ncbi:MAG: hypothetical protein ACLR17_06515 [Enterobacteriaceae bacterium]
MSPPTVRGLRQSSGFELWLQDSAENGRQALIRRKPPSSLPPGKRRRWTPCELTAWRKRSCRWISTDKSPGPGLDQAAINGTLSAAWGGVTSTILSTAGALSACICRGCGLAFDAG